MKLYLYITNNERFVNGELDFAFTVYADKDIVSRNEWDKVFVGEFEIDLPNPDSITQLAVADIDREIQQHRARAESEASMLETRKQNLLAITHQPDDAA